MSVRPPASRDRLVVLATQQEHDASGAGDLVRAADSAGWRVEVVTAVADHDETVSALVGVIGLGGADVLLCAPRPLGRAAAIAAARTDALLAHVEGDELVVVDAEPASDDALDQVHRERPDPWQVDSFYERRKRALTLASLPREHYGRAVEVGCSVGALAADLAQRCDHLLALDSSRTAVDLAARRTSDLDHVDVRRARVPDEWPEDRFDLVSISEVGYFLSPRELGDVAARVRASLTEDGHLLLCHWRHQPVGWPLAGPAVHEAFLATGAPVLVEHHEPDFLLHVLGRWS